LQIVDVFRLTLVTPFLDSFFLSRALFSAFKDPAHCLGWHRGRTRRVLKFKLEKSDSAVSV
jgi:hypothetical protein